MGKNLIKLSWFALLLSPWLFSQGTTLTAGNQNGSIVAAAFTLTAGATGSSGGPAIMIQ